jgi:hypothetical protein
MGGQVLGGGVIVLVAVLLWLVYLLPSWYSRRQFDAAERNAVRLNQALRVLAETSETPEEVRLELNARTALAQQRLARQALAAREEALLEESRADVKRAREESRLAVERARDQSRLAMERAREESRIAAEQARDQRAAQRSTPLARRARARRRTRLIITLFGLAAVGVAVWGGFEVVATGSQVLLWAGVASALVALLGVRRMTHVGARSAAKTMDAEPRVSAGVQDVALSSDPRAWAPRELPRPLTASAGSRAAAVLDGKDAREALRQAALEEEMRRLAEAQRPPSIATAPARAAAAPRLVGDAEIEAHVRELLARRAVGQ